MCGLIGKGMNGQTDRQTDREKMSWESEEERKGWSRELKPLEELSTLSQIVVCT